MNNTDILKKLPPDEVLHAYEAQDANRRWLLRNGRPYSEVLAAGAKSEEIREEILRRLKEHAVLVGGGT